MSKLVDRIEELERTLGVRQRIVVRVDYGIRPPQLAPSDEEPIRAPSEAELREREARGMQAGQETAQRGPWRPYEGDGA